MYGLDWGTADYKPKDLSIVNGNSHFKVCSEFSIKFLVLVKFLVLLQENKRTKNKRKNPAS